MWIIGRLSTPQIWHLEAILYVGQNSMRQMAQDSENQHVFP